MERRRTRTLSLQQADEFENRELATVESRLARVLILSLQEQTSSCDVFLATDNTLQYTFNVLVHMDASHSGIRYILLNVVTYAYLTS